MKNSAEWLIITMASFCIASAVAGEIPFPKALGEANVSLSSMHDGQRESLMLGNGDLYGIVWEKEGSLFMRITKNDIWDARVDTSGDGPLPHVDMATGKITGSTGAPPSYDKLYPQPRCATALRLGPLGPAGTLEWSCARGATKYALTPDADSLGAIMEVGGNTGESTGYQASLPDNTMASSLSMSIKGAANAHYYIDIFGKGGKPVYASGWTESPVAEKQIKDKKSALKFAKPATLKADLNLQIAVAAISSATGSATTIRILHDRNVVLVNSPHPVVLEPIQAATLPDAEIGKKDDNGKILLGPSYSPEHGSVASAVV